MPHLGAVLTPIRIVAEVNNYEREMAPTETEVPQVPQTLSANRAGTMFDVWERRRRVAPRLA